MHRSVLLLTLCLSLVLTFVPQAVQANTEKVIFTAKHISAPSADSRIDNLAKDSKKTHSVLDPAQWKRLSSPHTIIRAETLLPSFHENDLIHVLLEQAATQQSLPGSQKGTLVKDVEDGIDLQNREFKWYILEDLENGASFELRISYPSTSPADFDMKVWTLGEAQEQLPSEVRLADHFPQTAMFARVKATYTGISYQSNGTSSPETFPIPYNLVLERLYFMIPYQALKLAAVIAVVAVVGLVYIVPTTHRALLNIASGKSGITRDEKKSL
ncbi:hypothetical protein BGZ80_008238 [Entomortierella chlamydospora]|uniref:Protein BIG1 n=1 Tax=Entomortierella chlamydospora TaxID=101097 RepID=A0A9P6MYC1_9FUNG|nr:hypothetical protein BGZ79_005563 [Entomortierella chlamydospora]KAG0017490.1 hypothetical protein BGZ80_008238 [Entomortierella chlamydospora]